MATDVTDQTFEQEVLAASETTPIVLDLWAPWCGPCKSLGPILEKVVEETDGAVRLVKVNIDENPQVTAAFQVQSIPAVFAIAERKVVDSFLGALPEQQVREWVGRLAHPPSEADELADAGDEASLRRALELEPDHPGALVALAELLVSRGETEEALALLQRIPETAATRRVAAAARLGSRGVRPDSDEAFETRLQALLETVKTDDEARQEFVDLLETLAEDDPRRASYRRALTSRLF